MIESQSLPAHPNRAERDRLETGLLLGLDIGGTKIAALVADGNMGARATAVRPTNASSPAALVETITETVTEALHLAEGELSQVLAVGAGVPGQVEQESGVVRLAVNLGLERFELANAVQAALGAPVLLENDVRMAAVGAFEYLRRTSDLRHMAYMSVGTGISAGLILEGRLHRGAHGMAGEIGHAIVDPAAERCHCGARGCLEALASGPAIARQWQNAGAATRHEDSASAVYDAYRRGDPTAVAVVERASNYLAQAIQWLIMAYDVERVVLGGGVARAGNAFLQPVLVALSALRRQSTLAEVMLADEKVMLLPAEVDPATWGAVLLARRALASATIARSATNQPEREGGED